MKQFIVSCLCFVALFANAQSRLSKDTTVVKQAVTTINQALDQAVVDKKSAFMQQHYAPDFYFLHGTGQVDSKKSWMNYVLDSTTKYRSRTHDSVTVELHNDVAIVAGVLTVTRAAANKISGYALRYIRVYAFRKKAWQLLSHCTTREWQLQDESL